VKLLRLKLVRRLKASDPSSVHAYFFIVSARYTFEDDSPIG
jgi:hypothetical protein